MAGYHHKARASVEVFNGKAISFDSDNEVQLARWFEAEGFSWERNVGAANGGSRYTCDFELAVLDGGVPKRAIVEAKPYKEALTASIIRRMQGVAINYKTDLLLLYTRTGNCWYRIDVSTGVITPAATPIPSPVPLNKLSKGLSLTSEKRGGKTYDRRFNPGGWLADLVIGLIQGPKPKRRRKRR